MRRAALVGRFLSKSIIIVRGCVALLLLCSLALTGCGQDPSDEHSLLVRNHIYSYGTPIKFGLGEEWTRFATYGWSLTKEKGCAWTEGTAATFDFRVNRSDQPLTFRLRVQAMTEPPFLVSQPVDVSVGGIKIAHWDVGQEDTYKAAIPQEFVKQDTLLHIDLHIPKATAPAEIGGNPDPRRLGLCCYEMVLVKGAEVASLATTESILTGRSTGNPTSLRTLISFSATGGSAAYKVAGWSHQETQFTWTEGNSATVRFQVPENKTPLTLVANLSGAVVDRILPYQPTDVLANGEKVGHWEVAAPAEFRVDIPGEIPRPGGNLTIEFQMPRAASPKSLRANEDPRVLAIKCFDLRLETKDPSGVETIATPSAPAP